MYYTYVYFTTVWSLLKTFILSNFSQGMVVGMSAKMGET